MGLKFVKMAYSYTVDSSQPLSHLLYKVPRTISIKRQRLIDIPWPKRIRMCKSHNRFVLLPV